MDGRIADCSLYPPICHNTLQFPAVKAWRAQEAVPDGVEASLPGHSPDGGAGGWCRGRRSRWAVFRRVYRRSFGGRDRAAPWRRVGGHLYGRDRFGGVVRAGHRVEVV